MGIKNIVIDELKGVANKALVEPVRGLVDDSLKDIVTTIGSFVVRSVRGKFQRSITFTIGLKYYDDWMEEALYGIIYKYNNLRTQSRLELNNHGSVDGTSMYYQLSDGTHNLKYRDYNILLAIQTNVPTSTTGRVRPQRIYTIITYNLSEQFVKDFEKDMLAHRNSLLKIKKDSPTVNVYQDHHEGDGYTYWEKMHIIPKRRLATVYLPEEQKKRIVNTINEFFASKEYYRRHGIAHNLKILLYGPPGPQPVSEPILLSDGSWTTIGDLRPGDTVMSIGGEPATVEEIYEYESEDSIYEVELDDGSMVRCTADHKLPLYHHMYGTAPTPLSEIIKMHFKTQGVGHIFADAELPVEAPIYVRRKCILPERFPVNYNYSIDTSLELNHVAWILGFLYMSAKTIRDDHTVYIISNKIDEPAIKMFTTLTKTILCPVHDVCYRLSRKLNQDDPPTDVDVDMLADILHIDNRLLINILLHKQKIPCSIKYCSNVDTRMRFLRGMMDARACIGQIGVNEYALVLDRGLPDDMARMTSIKEILEFIRALGYIVREYCNDDTGQEWVQFNWYGTHEMCNLFDVSDWKQAIISNSSMCIFDFGPVNKHQRIKTIKHVGKEKVRCIHIDDFSHIYLSGHDLVPVCNSGKDSIAKMIASEWNRNMYYVTGGKDGKFVPNALTDDDDDVSYPLMLISDIDKYPYLIAEPDINIDDASLKEERIKQKQEFGAMINALDGVLSAEDRIIVMTTNHYEKFSSTFLRDGRVDLKEEIGYVTPEVFRKYCHDFYDYDLPEDIALVDKELTIAKLQTDVVFRKLSIEEFINKHVAGGKNKK